MRLSVKFIILTYFLSMAALGFAMSLDDCKKSLLTEYDKKVLDVARKLLSDLGLKIEDFNAVIPEMAGDFRDAHDLSLEDSVKSHESQGCQDAELKAVRNCVQSTLACFGFDKVEILHEHEFNLMDVGVMRSYSTGMVYVSLNARLYASNLEQLKAVLKHEVSHVIYNDNLVGDMMACFIWQNRPEMPRESIMEKLYPFKRMYETRADVHAAVHSPDHGEQLIKAFKEIVDEPAPPTHPKTADRLILLESIKARLDQAAL